MVRCICLLLLLLAAAWPLNADQLYTKNKKANQMYKKQQYNDALKLYDDLSLEAPNEPKIKMNKGSTHYQMGEFDKAQEAYNAALLGTKDKKTLADAYYNLGNIQYMEGEQLSAQGKQEAMDKYKSALENYIKSLDNSPRDRDAKWNLQLASAKIKEMQNQQQQNKNNRNKDDKNKNDKQNQQQNKDQKNDQNNKDQQNKDKQNKDQQNKDNKQQDKKDQDKQNQNPNDQNKQDQQKPEPTPAQQKKEDMKKDEARKLLEIYSDDEHDLNKKPEKQGIAGQRKSDKDW